MCSFIIFKRIISRALIQFMNYENWLRVKDFFFFKSPCAIFHSIEQIARYVALTILLNTDL